MLPAVLVTGEAGAMFHGWIQVYTPAFGEALICVPPKCGSTSLAVALLGGVANRQVHRTLLHQLEREGKGPFHPKVAASRDALPKFLAVREPLDRFRSMFAMTQKKGAAKYGVPESVDTPGKLIRWIAQCPLHNKHFGPQYLHRIPGARLVPFVRLLPLLGFEPVWFNKTDSAAVNIDPVTIAFVREHYAQDFTLWNERER